MKHLIIDGMNFMHRARAGFQLGPHPLMFNFFRNLRAQVELHKPDKVWYVLEGYPKHRHEALPEYKANRELQVEDPDYVAKVDEMKRFFAGNNDVLELMMKCFPITIVRHPDFECDDVIHYYAGTLLFQNTDEATIVSSDTDFIQSLQEMDHAGRLKLYNPMKKVFLEAPVGYNYVHWKALRGDGSDNIPGIPGVGDKTAAKLASVPGDIAAYLQSHPGAQEIFVRNLHLIRFHEFFDAEYTEIQKHEGKANWDEVKRVFESYNFNSITNDKSWKKFTETFEKATPAR